MKDVKKLESLLSSYGIELENSFSARMNFCAELVGNPSALAKAAGIAQSTIRPYFSGREPGRPHLIAIAEAAGVSVEWLATGKGSVEGYVKGMPDSTFTVREDVPSYSESGDFALVPLYDVRAAAGHGSMVELEKVVDYLAFKRTWLHRELGASASDLYLIYVSGESMEPTLRAGDVILIDRRAAADVPHDGIYVMRMDGSLLVKRLQRLPGRRVKVSSDNQAYQPFELALDNSADDLAIIGRVVWTGRRV